MAMLMLSLTMSVMVTVIEIMVWTEFLFIHSHASQGFRSIFINNDTWISQNSTSPLISHRTFQGEDSKVGGGIVKIREETKKVFIVSVRNC